jgi:hypothetical protein
MAADAQPNDMCLTGYYSLTVPKEGTTIRGPSHFEPAGDAVICRNSQALTELPAPQVLDKPVDRTTKTSLVLRRKRIIVALETG